MSTTFLNANPSNFRTLVQKFTGRSAGVNLCGRRKGPLTLDFRSPSSVSKEIIFPISGDLHNKQVCDGESHMTCEWEGTRAAPYQMGQISNESNDYPRGCDDHHAHGHHDKQEDGDLLREYLENSSFNGVGYSNFNDFYHDAVLLEEFMMRDLDF